MLDLLKCPLAAAIVFLIGNFTFSRNCSCFYLRVNFGNVSFKVKTFGFLRWPFFSKNPPFFQTSFCPRSKWIYILRWNENICITRQDKAMFECYIQKTLESLRVSIVTPLTMRKSWGGFNFITLSFLEYLSWAGSRSCIFRWFFSTLELLIVEHPKSF